MFLITRAINVPLNDDLAAAGAPGRISDFAAARHDFERPWVVWNVIRTVANTAALGCLVYALVVFGRSTADAGDVRESGRGMLVAETRGQLASS